MNEPFLKQLEEEIQVSLSDPTFSTQDLALRLGMSHSSLLRKVKSATGKTINQLIKEKRLVKALELLEKGTETLSEVAFKTGFSSQAYFTACFRKEFGYTPGTVQANHNDHSIVKTDHPQSSIQIKSIQHRTVLFVALSVVIIVASIFIFLSFSGGLRQGNSIAVIPFRNNGLDTLSSTATEVFREQLILALTRIQAFNVRSSISSGIYTKDEKSKQKIGKELDARYLIDGSADFQDGLTKITVQVFDAQRNEYKEAMDYIFNPEDIYNQLAEIAENVAYQLNTRVLSREKSAIVQRPVLNQEAYQNYLRGMQGIDRESPMEINYALKYFEKAIELEPSWADPYLGKSIACIERYRYTYNEFSLNESFKAASKAHSMRPGPDTYLVLARYYRELWDFKKAARLLKKALLENPEDPDANLFMSKVCVLRGRWKKALKYVNDAIRYFRESPITDGLLTRARIYERLRDYPNALKATMISKLNNPEYASFYINLHNLKTRWKSNLEEARKLLEELIEAKAPINNQDLATKISYYLVMNNICSGKYGDALNEMSNLYYEEPRGRGHYPFFYRPKYLLYGMLHGYLGESDLEKAYYDSTRIYVEGQLKELPLYEKDPMVHSCLAVVWANLGNREKAYEMADKVSTLIKGNPIGFFSTLAREDIAWMHTILGEQRKAIKILRNLLARPGFLTANLLKLDPKWEPLWDLPEYKRLIRRFSKQVQPNL